MRDYALETQKRVAFIREILRESGAKGIVYGNSGGKDCTLVGILCKKACENTIGIVLPCSSKRNYTLDKDDAWEVAKKYGIETRIMDVTPVKEAIKMQLSEVTELTPLAEANIAPRLRMTALYAVAASENLLVAGTGNRSERYVGYFTKWGDGAFDFNPIADLTVREIYEFLRYLDCPACIINKAPSAALFEGQTDEDEMGIKYDQLDDYLLTGTTDEGAKNKIERMHARTEHKRVAAKIYEDK